MCCSCVGPLEFLPALPDTALAGVEAVVFYIEVSTRHNCMIKPSIFSFGQGFAAALAAALWCAGLTGSPARAAVVSDLYQASVPVTDRTEAGLSAAFGAALRQVLVKMTGRRSAALDPAFSPLLASARRYMQQYRSGTGNQIWVAFDGAALDRWLVQNGQPSWGRDRPVTLMWVGVADRKGGGRVLTREDDSDLRHALDAQAASRGIPLQWPSALDAQKQGVTYETLSQGPGSTLADSAKRLGASGVLIGRASDARPGSPIRWLFLFQGRSSEYSGADEGLERVADSYASLYAASGDSVAVDLDVTGVTSLAIYASVQGYLESLTQVSRVGVTGFDADTMHLRVAARGGLAPLRRVIAEDRRLTEEPGVGGVPRFRAVP